MRPILANSCAAAATTAEARYRLPILPQATWRSSRVVALDPAAAEVVRRVAAQPWASATFYTLAGTVGTGTAGTGTAGTGTAGVLYTLDDAPYALAEVLPGADLAVLVATSDSGAAMAAAIGAECRTRSIMTAGLIIGEGPDRVVSALRPYARVLMVTRDEQDVAEILTALRA
ncbi:MAG TPA: hypothetical protein VKB69_14430 [Micromonosporaceae bacterium]|nr:hypothetical protein [Micromonosporaceae bacterium]